jgi:sulfite exporter TauE/SafE
MVEILAASMNGNLAGPVIADGVTALAGTVLLSSLLGSAHCAGMCGGLALAASGPVGGGAAGDASRAARQLGYHGGRLVSYAAVGVLAGLAGQVVDDAGVLIGVQRVAAIAAGTVIALFGAAAVARAFDMPVPSAGVPMPLVRMAQRVHAWTLRLPPRHRGIPIGLATALLPCGWLYAFAAIAAASASPLVGAFVMAAFWLGTVPALVIAANGARMAFARLGRAAPVIAGLAMMAVGVHAAVSRSAVAEAAMSEVRAVKAAGAGASIGELACEAEARSGELPPCCREKQDAAATAGKAGAP